MSTTSRKNNNIALRVAIVRSGAKQNVIAKRARINEVRFSKIVCGRVVATPDEMGRLETILGTPATQLFPDAVTA